ncbi:hypothetical protein CRG98_012522 [Punica granatum]|uniref:LOB domain-containing protein n=1 Tax=Punica granatum TaxID=22663 RepID=A0A2I0KF15_PUNGR|nr:hypothetical protein CRG98_012522 [Punica granatum]
MQKTERSNNRGGGGGGASGPCGACKFLRRKCVNGCVFAPYFDSEQGATHFAAVHKVFGASNASKLLLCLPPHRRLDAVLTLCYEAIARVRDPVYGCVAHIFTLQQQVVGELLYDGGCRSPNCSDYIIFSLRVTVDLAWIVVARLEPPPPLSPFSVRSRSSTFSYNF